MTVSGKATPWFLSAPALTLFAALLVTPLAMTFLLSFNSFSFYGGIENTFGLENYAEVLSDTYFYEIFGRTFLIAFITTAICAVLGLPEAYILFRMKPAWRSFMLLIVLGPIAYPIAWALDRAVEAARRWLSIP